MRILQPAKSLSPYIRHYWLTHDDADSSHVILPDGSVDAVMQIGRTTTTRIYGPATRRAVCTAFSGHHHLGICFRPGQARHFLGFPVSLATDTSVEMDRIAGLDPAQLADDIALGTVLERLDHLLCSHSARHVLPGGRIDRALQVINVNDGGVRLEPLALSLGTSSRQLQRQFLDQVGVTPKTYARIRRLRRALSLVCAQSGLLVDIATQAGYADQSHMNRDFQTFLGQSPGSLTDVAFVQDPAFSEDYVATT